MLTLSEDSLRNLHSLVLSQYFGALVEYIWNVPSSPECQSVQVCARERGKEEGRKDRREEGRKDRREEGRKERREEGRNKTGIEDMGRGKGKLG